MLGMAMALQGVNLVRPSGSGGTVTRHRDKFKLDGERMADFALRLIAEPSPSGQEGRVAELVRAEMAALGYAVDVDDMGNVIGVIEAGPGPCVLIDSHMDTVGEPAPEQWTHDLWGERVGSRIYGRGAMDMKGPLAAAVHGIALLRGRLEGGRVVVSATVAEELVEGPALEYVAGRVGADAVIICEASSLKLARAQRGRAEIRIEVQGQPTHSARPELGVNAAEAMADVIQALRSVTAPRHEVLGDGILVLTDIVSDPYPGLSVVPARCTATYDRRTLPGETESTVLEPVRRVIAEVLRGTEARGTVSIALDDFQTYTGKRITAPNFAPAWFFDEDALIVRRAMAGLARVGMRPELGHYLFCTNGSGTAGRRGIPTIGFGPGNEELAHRVDEHIDLSDLETAARAYAAIALELTEMEI